MTGTAVCGFCRFVSPWMTFVLLFFSSDGSNVLLCSENSPVRQQLTRSFCVVVFLDVSFRRF